MTERGLFVGRFQPLHQGHVEALSVIEGEVDELVIVIGSSQSSHSLENPFTAGERVLMLDRALSAHGIEAIVVPVPDVNRNSIWAHHVETYVPPFDTVFTNNALPSRLFAEAGYDVRGFELVDRKRYEGTYIRELMLEGGDWQDRVPDPVVEIVDRVDGIERMRALTDSDAADRDE
jgi:nicotinamide-nucleotide adenylyltransferase